MARWRDSILKAGGATTDFSERNLAYQHGFDLGPNDGGSSYMSEAYLSRFSGPISESADPYSAMGTADSVTGPAQDYVREMLRFDSASEMKNAIMTYGGLYTTMYMDPAYYRSSDYTYYYNGSAAIDHAVTVVGWDDNKPTAGGTGAWLIKFMGHQPVPGAACPMTTAISGSRTRTRWAANRASRSAPCRQ